MAYWTNRHNRVKYQKAITDRAMFKYALENKMRKIKVLVLSSWIITLIALYLIVR